MEFSGSQTAKRRRRRRLRQTGNAQMNNDIYVRDVCICVFVCTRAFNSLAGLVGLSHFRCFVCVHGVFVCDNMLPHRWNCIIFPLSFRTSLQDANAAPKAATLIMGARGLLVCQTYLCCTSAGCTPHTLARVMRAPISLCALSLSVNCPTGKLKINLDSCAHI